MGNRIIGMVLFPGITQLDLTGPYEVFAQLPHTKVYLLAATLEPVASDKGLAIVPNCTFSEAPQLDVLFVPGGPGVSSVMEDELFIGFLRQQGQQAAYVTSVCTGSLLLAAVGLLDGYRATTHWLSLDLLRKFGVEVVAERVVKDRNRITGGGVTAGIDFGLTLAAEWHGETVAKQIQLMLEYDPEPPFNSGSPQVAHPDLIERVREDRRDIQTERANQIGRILAKRSR